MANVCLGRRYSVHHRAKRGQGGGWSPANLLAACGSGTTGCHGYVEANPTWSRDHGLWLFTGDGAPSGVSCYMRWHDTKSWWVLDDEGMLEWDGGPFDPVVLAPPNDTRAYRSMRVG